jgi:hypothetical protein
MSSLVCFQACFGTREVPIIVSDLYKFTLKSDYIIANEKIIS